MWKRSGSVFLATAAAAATIGLGVSQAVAATWTVKPGGSITGKSGTTTLTDKNTGNKLTCSSSKATGTLKSGKGLSGTGIGRSRQFPSATAPARSA